MKRKFFINYEGMPLLGDMMEKSKTNIIYFWKGNTLITFFDLDQFKLTFNFKDLSDGCLHFILTRRTKQC